MTNKPKKRKLKKEVKILLTCMAIFLVINIFDVLQNKIDREKKVVEENKKVVAIDIGHGGNDQGTQGVSDKIIEKNLTLEIGKNVIDKLEKEAKVKVITTRSDDEYVSLSDRAKIANENNADIFVSIHCNATPDGSSSANGIETFYWKNETEDSYKLAETIHNTIVSSLDINDRGVKRESYQVLRESNSPSILIETGFLTNYKEAQNLSSKKYQSEISDAIVQGINEYLQINEDVSN